MKEARYDDVVILYREIDSIRKSSEQTAPKFIINFSIKEGLTRDITSAGIEHTKKIFAESRCFRFVPGKAADSIRFDFG